VEASVAASDKLTTRVSTKGQVILPKAVRARRQWLPGQTLVVEETAEGVLLRAEHPFPRTRHEDVAGMLKHAGAAKSVEAMDEAIARAIRERHDRGRY
jgi:AbrB family looped-hinge helix DNA binding protein